jgi:hypothetical protein
MPIQEIQTAEPVYPRSFFVQNGKAGGSSKSPKKKRAVKANLKKALSARRAAKQPIDKFLKKLARRVAKTVGIPVSAFTIEMAHGMPIEKKRVKGKR